MRMKGKYGKEDARLSFCSELWHGTLRSTAEKGASIGLTVLAWLEMLIGECRLARVCRCCRCFCISFGHLSIVASDTPGFMGFLSPVTGVRMRLKAAEALSRRAVKPFALRWFSWNVGIASRSAARR
jgi:hypothetical protein